MSHSTAAAADIALRVYIPLRIDTHLFGQVTTFQSNTNLQREYFMFPPLKSKYIHHVDMRARTGIQTKSP